MIHGNHNDETLVMLTLAGDQSAYETLVRRYQNAVIASADSVIHSRFMAEDAAQDAFVTAWMKLNTLQDAEKFGAWVCRIAKNCALDTARRYRNYMPLETIENIDINGDRNQNPAELLALSEEKAELNKSVSHLPEKVQKIIRLHYFEGLTVSEIAERMGISAGTVKSQLHDGRKRIRKELCAMNEHWNDTLVQRVMKKVEELKLWQYKNSKNGFEKIYKDVLAEVEELPECKDKYHALADVLMRGWWWIPGKKNDALFARIKEAAELGKNDDVMIFIVQREGEDIYGEAKTEFIRDVQIPYLEKSGFNRALAFAWYHLATYYHDQKKIDEAFAALKKTMELSPSNDIYYQLSERILAEREWMETFSGKNVRSYKIMLKAEEYRYIGGELHRSDAMSFGDGDIYSYDQDIERIFENASYCDRKFTEKTIALGETHIGSDGTRFTFESNSETVETECGIFENCELWVWRNKSVKCSTWYKEGIGIVKQTRTKGGVGETRTLKAYDIKGGQGLVPLHIGNSWEYVANFDSSTITHSSVSAVAYADSEKVILNHVWSLERLKYDENCWIDMIRQVRNEYWGYANGNDGKEIIRDVYYPIERSLALAKTDMEKAHAKASASVAKRIMETDPEFNPEYKATGHWNFFGKDTVAKNGGVVTTEDEFQWSFEWKHAGDLGVAGRPILSNDIYGIINDAVDCIWNDEWRIGYSETRESLLWGNIPLTVKIDCTDAGVITTSAGKFENCLKVALDINGLEENYGLSYRGGKRAYYFAPNIGIVRAENDYAEGTRIAVYDLVYYEKEGEGYMPVEGGLVRRYEAMNLTDGFKAGVEYTYASDDEGNIAIFQDRTGIREVSSPATHYSAVQGERKEAMLWGERKEDESRKCHDINNFHLMSHFICRNSRIVWEADKAVAWGNQQMQIIENLGVGGTVPPAWMGKYINIAFRTGCRLCGMGRGEEGREYIEKAFSYIDEWASYPDEAELEVGNPLIYGGVKLVKGKSLIRLPDGNLDYYSYGDALEFKPEWLHKWLTANIGWEWFDSVRNEDWYKDYIKRAEKYKK